MLILLMRVFRLEIISVFLLSELPEEMLVNIDQNLQRILLLILHFRLELSHKLSRLFLQFIQTLEVVPALSFTSLILIVFITQLTVI